MEFLFVAVQLYEVAADVVRAETAQRRAPFDPTSKGAGLVELEIELGRRTDQGDDLLKRAFAIKVLIVHRGVERTGGAARDRVWNFGHR